MALSFRASTPSVNVLTELLAFIFSCNSGLMLIFLFCEQILVENGTKAGHCLLMDARDLVLKVRFFLLPSPLHNHLSPVPATPLRTEETLSYKW